MHDKAHLPDEKGYWEASWYGRGPRRFRAFKTARFRAGFLICTDLWFFGHSRRYGRQGVQLLLCPRATPRSTLDKWLAGGRAAAVVSGAFVLSSNKSAAEDHPARLGGQGWVVGPDGDVLGLTSKEKPFLTLDLDLEEAERSKSSYPRYVRD